MPDDRPDRTKYPTPEAAARSAYFADLETRETGHSHPKWLPCPFCGSSDVRKMPAGEGGFVIECANRTCGVSTPIVFAIKESPDEKLADIWSRRVGARVDGNTTSETPRLRIWALRLALRATPHAGSWDDERITKRAEVFYKFLVGTEDANG